VNEHEFEPVRGLPERLPDGEQMLWQGTPDWRSLALHAFHARKLTIYFAVLLIWRAATVVWGGGTLGHAAIAVLWLLPFAAAAVALVAFVAWLMARAAVYTITNRRVVMRIGVVLEVTFNLPFRVIESAGLREYADGTGDIPLVLSGEDRIAYAHLWPHARPWRMGKPEPMLRAIPDAARVAGILAHALAAHAGVPARSMTEAANGPMGEATHTPPFAAAAR
jgi:hypothetical protein